MSLDYSKTMIEVNAIYAHGRNGEFALSDGSLPWKQVIDLTQDYKIDMEHFKKKTINQIIIMGFNTYKLFNSPLKNRINIVIDKNCINNNFIAENEFNFFNNIETTLLFLSQKKYSEKKVFLIGGAKLLEYAFLKNLINGKIYETIFFNDFPDATIILKKSFLDNKKIKILATKKLEKHSVLYEKELLKTE